MITATISGSGLWIPPHTITNDDLVRSFNEYVRSHNEREQARIAAGEVQALAPSSVEFIEKASGIRQRYVLDREGVLDPERMRPRFAPRADGELSLMAEIGVHACRAALADAGREASDVDAVICAASNMQRAYPAMAIEIQDALGIEGFGFDVNVACSSATFGIEQAANAVRAGTARAVLVVSPEITSGHLAWRDRDCHFIFGDVASAVLIERADAARPGSWRILGTRLATKFSNNIRNNLGFLNRAEDRDPDARDLLFVQEGRKVFKEVCPMAADHIAAHLTSVGLAPAAVRRYWLHQANLAMNQLIARRLLGRDATPDDAPVILDEFANTSSAGSVIAFHRHRADLGEGDVGVLCSFGAGYSIGSVVVRRA